VTLVRVVSLMPYSIFLKLHLGPLQPAPFSLQLVDGSQTQRLGMLEDGPVKVGDLWVLEDFIIANTTETDDAQTILGRSFLATLGYTIDVKEGWMTFEVGGVMLHFCLMEDKIVSLHSFLSDVPKMVSPNCFLSDVLSLSPKIEMDDD